jgi:arylsulfatase
VSLEPRRTILLAIALLAGACGRESRGPSVRRVILVTCDTLRADHLSCYGYALPTSPNVDAFAREATLFENAWSTSSLTGPALSALLAGRMPDEIGVAGGNKMVMRPDVVTFPELLAQAGIATAAVVSNWVLARPPRELGDAGVSQGFQSFDDHMTTPELNRPFSERRAAETAAAAIAWLESRPRIAEEPFFLWVHFQDPHGPYTPSQAHAEEFLQPLEGAETPLPLGKDQGGKGQIPAYQALGEERRPSRYRARYDGEIREFDEGFGRLMGWLREHALLDDALVVFTADHGESLGEHDLWFCHGQNLHAEEARVPLLVRFPGGAGRGETRRDLVGHLDLQPTVLEAFGLRGSKSLGLSLDSAALEPDRIVPCTLNALGSPRRAAALTSGGYRLLLDASGGARLFDLARDPGELEDLSQAEPERVRALRARGAALVEPKSRSAPGLEPSDEGRKQALRSLGYVEGSEEH